MTSICEEDRIKKKTAESIRKQINSAIFCINLWLYQLNHRRSSFKNQRLLSKIYFRFSTVWRNHLRNKHLAEYLRNNSNELAIVRFSAFYGAILSNNSFNCKSSEIFKETRAWMIKTSKRWIKIWTTQKRVIHILVVRLSN